MQVSEVDEVMQSLGVEKATKVLILGNSGVGKSFLCNVILQHTTFASKTSFDSVTWKVEVEASSDIDGEAYVIYNIPGLLEVDEANVARNKACIKQAFEQHPHLAPHTVVLFVLGNQNGRLLPDDIAAWHERLP